MSPRPALAAALALTLGLAATAALAASPDEIVRNVERLADRAKQSIPPENKAPAALLSAPSGQPADTERCRTVTQTITHQGVSQTKSIRLCRDPAWWKEWAAKAQPSPAPSTPAPVAPATK